MTDYSFMKSGFDNLNGGVDERDIVLIMTTFMMNGLKNSDIYVRHCDRNGITKEDIKRGLMLEVFLFFKRDNLVNNIEEMKESLYGIYEEAEELDDLLMDEDEMDEFKLSKCDCAICKCMNGIYERWDNFVPNSPMENILKTHIDNI